MNTAYLLTNRDDIDDIVRTEMMSLPSAMTFLNGRFHTNTKLTRVSSAHAGKMKLALPELPVLLIIDGAIPDRDSDPISTDGKPAAEFLDWLRQLERAIPAIVVSPALLPMFGPKNLLVPNVASWEISPGQTGGLKNALSSFDSRSHRWQITITVGEYEAKYNISDNASALSYHHAYRNRWLWEKIQNEMASFVPYKDSRTETSWQTKLEGVGERLYRLLIDEVFDPKWFATFGEGTDALDFRFYVDRDQFPDEQTFQRLFLMPYEVTNAEENVDKFFCVGFPMARQISPSYGNTQYVSPERIRLLLVIGAEGGLASAVSEETGEALHGKLPSLHRTDELVAYFRESENSIDLDLHDSRKMTGATFLGELERKLKYLHYDIIHFYGHSISGSHGTFLFAPGDHDMTTKPISIRSIADWLMSNKDGGGPPSLVFLSSCESSSVRTVIEMMDAGVMNVLGFRWEVEETAALHFVKKFYDAYLGGHRAFSTAYREACDGTRRHYRGIPAWASAMALVHH